MIEFQSYTIPAPLPSPVFIFLLHQFPQFFFHTHNVTAFMADSSLSSFSFSLSPPLF